MSLPCLGLSYGFVWARPRIDQQMHVNQHETRGGKQSDRNGRWNLKRLHAGASCLPTKPTTTYNLRRCSNSYAVNRHVAAVANKIRTYQAQNRHAHRRVYLYSLYIPSLIDNTSFKCVFVAIWSRNTDVWTRSLNVVAGSCEFIFVLEIKVLEIIKWGRRGLYPNSNFLCNRKCRYMLYIEYYTYIMAVFFRSYEMFLDFRTNLVPSMTRQKYVMPISLIF